MGIVDVQIKKPEGKIHGGMEQEGGYTEKGEEEYSKTQCQARGRESGESAASAGGLCTAARSVGGGCIGSGVRRIRRMLMGIEELKGCL